MRWSLDVYMALHLHQISIPGDVLPNLRHINLEMMGSMEAPMSQLPFILSRSVTSISSHLGWQISHDDMVDHSLSFLSYLPSMCPQVTSISIQSRQPLPTVLIEPISHCVHLRTFHCLQPIPVDIALQLAKLPNLEDLSLNLDEESGHIPVSSSSQAPYQHTFDSLQSLGLTSEFIQSPLGPFLLSCQFPSLEVFQMTLGPETPLFPVLNALRNRCTPDTLHTVDVTGQPEDEIDFADIRPLLSFRGLQYVDLFVVPVMDDHALGEMASAWPQLKRLMLGGLRSDTVPKITLSGLIPLVKHCPKLESLSISLDARNPPFSQDQTPGSGVSNPILHSAHFFRSPIDQCYKVAAFLSGIFPNLKSVRADFVEEDGGSDDWKAVNQAIEVFAAVRTQERQTSS